MNSVETTAATLTESEVATINARSENLMSPTVPDGGKEVNLIDRIISTLESSIWDCIADGTIIDRPATRLRLELFFLSPMAYLKMRKTIIEGDGLEHFDRESTIDIEGYDDLLFRDMEMWVDRIGEADKLVEDIGMADAIEWGDYEPPVTLKVAKRFILRLFDTFNAIGQADSVAAWWTHILYGYSRCKGSGVDGGREALLSLKDTVIEGYKAIGIKRGKRDIEGMYADRVADIDTRNKNSYSRQVMEDAVSGLGDDIEAVKDIKSLLKRYIHLQKYDKFLDLQADDTVLTINSLIHSYLNKGIFNGQLDSQVKQELFNHPGLISASDSVYLPGVKERLVTQPNGDHYYNSWRDTGLKGVEDDISRWLDLLEWLLPDEEERTHLLDILSWKMRHPGEKQNHGVLLAGAGRIGKDAILQPFFLSFGDSNTLTVDAEDLAEKYQDYLVGKVVVVFNEIMSFGGRKDIENKIKPYCAAPPLHFYARLFGEKHVCIPNIIFPFFMSNYRTAMSMTLGNDRLYSLWAEPTFRRHTTMDKPDESEVKKQKQWAAEDKKSEDYYTTVYDWLDDEGGNEAVIYWLLHREISADYNPKAPARLTSYGREVQESSKPELQMILESMFEESNGGGSASCPTKHKIISVDELIGFLKEYGSNAAHRYNRATRMNVTSTLHDMKMSKIRLQDRKLKIDRWGFVRAEDKEEMEKLSGPGVVKIYMDERKPVGGILSIL